MDLQTQAMTQSLFGREYIGTVSEKRTNISGVHRYRKRSIV